MLLFAFLSILLTNTFSENKTSDYKDATEVVYVCEHVAADRVLEKLDKNEYRAAYKQVRKEVAACRLLGSGVIMTLRPHILLVIKGDADTYLVFREPYTKNSQEL